MLSSEGCGSSADRAAKLLECATLQGVREHQAQFQKIADNNDDQFYPGSRVAGTKGYADSVAYVAGLLRAAGYRVTLVPFQFQFVFPALLQQLTRSTPSTRRGPLPTAGTATSPAT
jgi:hypothetical protein